MEANFPILLVEDDPNDVWLVKHAFQSANISNPLRIVNDGQEAIDYLKGNGAYSDRGAFPSTVLSEGEYLVLAKLGDQVFNREIQVQPGSPREIEVLTSIY